VILQPLPTASVAIIGMTLAMLTRTESAADALSG
jgi:DASS family divalent anion:Na+ symporter